jgi:hypothetical protein
VWETVNEVLAGQVRAGRVALAVPLLAAFAALIVWGTRLITRAVGAPAAGAAASPDEPDIRGTLVILAVLLILMGGGWVMMYLKLLAR